MTHTSLVSFCEEDDGLGLSMIFVVLPILNSRTVNAQVVVPRAEANATHVRAWVGQQGVRLGGATSNSSRGGVVQLGPMTLPEARTFTLYFGFDAAAAPLESAR